MNIYGVVFKDNGRIYYFNGGNLDLSIDSNVIVETERGLQFGKVKNKISENELKIPFESLKKIERAATKKDYDNYLRNIKDQDLALKDAKNISKELGLDMNFIEASFTFDRKQLMLTFFASERIDFRELVKRLASLYHTRIELRQVGPRDKATQVGGIGPCGRILCCITCNKSPDSVSISMAKNQNISLSPSKINGACGRLKCCLVYEDEMYIDASHGMPSVGSQIKGGTVISVDILNRKYKLLVDDEVKEINLDERSK